jgi:hypothetical protein
MAAVCRAGLKVSETTCGDDEIVGPQQRVERLAQSCCIRLKSVEARAQASDTPGQQPLLEEQWDVQHGLSR